MYLFTSKSMPKSNKNMYLKFKNIYKIGTFIY